MKAMYPNSKIAIKIIAKLLPGSYNVWGAKYFTHAI